MPLNDTFRRRKMDVCKLYLLLLDAENQTLTLRVFGKNRFSQTNFRHPTSNIQSHTITMKQLFALALFLISTLAVSAQDVKSKPPAATPPANDAAAREATDKLVAKYTLNADQAKEMFTIQKRKLRNLDQIASLQTSNRSLYLSKLESLQKSTLASIRRVLRSKEQVELYNKTQADVRIQRAAKRKELAAQKLPKDDLQAILLEIYAE